VSHSRRSILVHTPEGIDFTTIRGKRRLLARHLAIELENGDLEMVARDYRIYAEHHSPAGARFRIVPSRPPAIEEGFLRYPQPMRITAARRLRYRYPGLARRAA